MERKENVASRERETNEQLDQIKVAAALLKKSSLKIKRPKIPFSSYLKLYYKNRQFF